MAPLHPPFPAAWNAPFQPDAGIQTSILISESAEGLMVAATRHNAGSVPSAVARAGGGVDAGSVSLPASTASAVVIVVFGSLNDCRASQEPAACGPCAESAHAIAVAASAPINTFMACRI